MSTSIAPISSSNSQIYQTAATSQFKKLGQDFKSLQSALASGNLSSAQQAFASLQKDLQGNSSSSSTSQNSSQSQSSPLSQDMQSLQSALQSGNLVNAQQAFSALQQDMKTSGGRGHHHHHGGGGGESSLLASTDTTTSSASSSSSSSSSSGTGSVLNVSA